MKKIIACILIMLLVCGCSQNGKSSSTQLFCMDTVMDIRIFGENSEDALQAVSDELYRIESLLDRKSDESDIYKLNNQKEAGIETIKLLKDLLEVSEKTDGAFDVTVAPVMDLWGFYDQNYRVPEPDKIKNALKSVGYRNVVHKNSGVSLLNNAKLDMGGAGKGYASDKAVEILKEYNIESAMLNLGGNVYAYGKRTDGKLWRVGIANPFNGNANEIITVDVEDKAVVTSGGYRRYFEENGREYHHIINPHTGYPAESDIKSVTVISESGTYADAYSTALFVMGSEKAVEFLKTSDIDAIIVCNDKTIYYTDTISGALSISDGFYGKEINKNT